MIRYTLKCSEQHQFDSWFADASAFETLSKAGQLSCPLCGTGRVEKALMAPSVQVNRKNKAASVPAMEPVKDQPLGQATPSAIKEPSLAAPGSELETAIRTLRRHVEENSDYVGKDFASEARRMHEGEAPERAIWGEAKPEEARALIEDGISVLPLPFGTGRKTN